MYFPTLPSKYSENSWISYIKQKKKNSGKKKIDWLGTARPKE